MVVIGDEDLVAGLEVDALHHDVATLAGIARDGDFVGRDAQHGGDLFAQRFAQGFVLGAILEGGIRVEVTEELRVSIEHRARGRAHVRRIEVDQIIFERELALDQRPVGLAHGIRSESYWSLVKRQFPLEDNLVYLNAANVCPASRPVLDRHAQFLRDFHSNPSFQNRAKYETLREALREKIAAMLRVSADEIAITRNTSEGSNIVVKGVDLKPGDEDITTNHNHPP